MRVVVATVLLFSICFATEPKRRFVPDKDTAVKIAEAVLIPIYGRKQIESERPFKASLQKGVWIVTGTLHCKDQQGQVTESCKGGTAVLELSEEDARILSVMHYK